ncbi:MAG: ester cyclase [Phycisphaerales bacterium]
MSSIKDTAHAFFDACETGKGWDVCKQYCHPAATFSGQAGSLDGIDTLETYANWMQGIFTPMPDASYEIHAFAVDDDRHTVAGFGVFKGTHTGEGGPVPPTGKATASEFVYVMRFEGDKIAHMTKVWNDAFAFNQVGWA